MDRLIERLYLASEVMAKTARFIEEIAALLQDDQNQKEIEK